MNGRRERERERELKKAQSKKRKKQRERKLDERTGEKDKRYLFFSPSCE